MNIEVEQAVFSSARSGSNQGYHLVARSAGIDEAMAHTLSRWSPSHGGLATGESESLNYFPVDAEHVAISRTCYGGPEYSRRGSMQLVTSIMVVTHQQLAAYDHNPVAMAQVAMRDGQLMLQPGLKRRLATLEIPGSSALTGLQREVSRSISFEQIRRTSQLQKRVALIGLENPLDFLWAYATGMKPDEVTRWSFSTGLAVSDQRPFAMQCFRQPNYEQVDIFRSKGVSMIDVSAACESSR